ncbi:MAG TPA: threonine ammonia-lyase [Cerasibacillus sp.]|uniref:threonine ammonia-lyase n=1 Tax=Cerasibacillus sp. TaxID=2498711 RepID=UPI002F42D61A
MNPIGDLLTSKHVVKAMGNLIELVHRTPLKQSTTLNRITGSDVFLKLENLQKTGSFKIRGALNKVLSLPEDEAKKGIFAASAGNHAQGIALACSLRGVPSKIFMPKHTPLSKVSATRQYGAEAILVGDTYQESYSQALEEVEKAGSTYVHAFDDYRVMAGQGTIALEMLQQNSQLDMIFVSVGGGGLISGMAVAAKAINPRIKIVGVQAEGASATYKKFHGIHYKGTERVGTIADGILVKEPGQKTYPLIQKYVDEMVTVSDEEIAYTIMFMLEREKMLVEGAGAAALAAVLYKKIITNGKNIGCVISGGNADSIQFMKYRELAEGAMGNII